MNCHKVNESLYAYNDGTLSPTQTSKIAQHLDECALCRSQYQITMMETESLRDTTDIPALAANFTAMVISSLQAANGVSALSDSQPLNSKFATFFRSRSWYQIVGPAVALIALSLYLPQLFTNDIAFNVASNDSYISQPMLSPMDEGIPAPAFVAQKSPISTVPSLREARPPVISELPMSERLGAAIDNQPLTPTQPNTSLVPKSIAPTVPEDAAPLTSALSSADGGSSTLIPQNVPTRFQLVEVDILDGNKTVYNYSSLDELEKLQIVVVPFSDKTSKTLPLTRYFELGDKKLTVTFSGNLAPEELERLAGTIHF